MTTPEPFVSSEVDTPSATSNLVDRLGEEADLCRNDGANDIADLLDEARAALVKESSGALVAAAQGSEAVTELLRYHREGPQAYSAFGDVDVVELLAEAVLHAGRIAINHLAETEHNREYRDEIGQLTAAAARFIDGWAG